MLPQLDVNINDVETRMPMIPDRTQVPAVVESAVVEENKSKTGHNLVVSFKTSEPVEESTVPGKPVPAGRELKNYYPLQPSEKQIEAGNENAWLERVCILLDALLGCSKGNRPSLVEGINELHGKSSLLTIQLEESDQFGTQNRIRKVGAPA